MPKKKFQCRVFDKSSNTLPMLGCDHLTDPGTGSHQAPTCRMQNCVPGTKLPGEADWRGPSGMTKSTSNRAWDFDFSRDVSHITQLTYFKGDDISSPTDIWLFWWCVKHVVPNKKGHPKPCLIVKSLRLRMKTFIRQVLLKFLVV